MSFFKIISPKYLAALLLACCLLFLSAQAPISREYQVKAGFLFNFTQFVEWSPGSFSSPQTPLVISVVGENPFGSYLEELVAGEKLNEHPLTVKYYKSLEELKPCHILFINISDADKVEQVLASLKGKHVLTVSDSPGFMKQGGMIKFFTENNKIRLQINPEASKACDLVISSKLLRLAEIFIPSKK